MRQYNSQNPGPSVALILSWLSLSTRAQCSRSCIQGSICAKRKKKISRCSWDGLGVFSLPAFSLNMTKKNKIEIQDKKWLSRRCMKALCFSERYKTPLRFPICWGQKIDKNWKEERRLKSEKTQAKCTVPMLLWRNELRRGIGKLSPRYSAWELSSQAQCASSYSSSTYLPEPRTVILLL